MKDIKNLSRFTKRQKNMMDQLGLRKNEKCYEVLEWLAARNLAKSVQNLAGQGKRSSAAPRNRQENLIKNLSNAFFEHEFHESHEFSIFFNHGSHESSPMHSSFPFASAFIMMNKHESRPQAVLVICAPVLKYQKCTQSCVHF